MKKLSKILAIFAASMLIGWGTAELIISSGKSGGDIPPNDPPASDYTASPISSTRYVATSVEEEGGNGETLNYRLDHSFSTSNTMTNTEYNVYYLYLGKVDWVPITSNTAKHFNGVTPIELTYSASQTTEASVAKSMSDTISNTTQTITSHSNTVDLKGSATFKTPFLEAAIESGFSDTWARETSASNQISKTDTYSTFQSWASQNTETIRFTIGDNGESSGFYRYALFATCDVYVTVVQNLTDDIWGFNYSVFARSNSLFEGIDYSTANQFGVGANAIALRFDTALIPNLPDLPKPDPDQQAPAQTLKFEFSSFRMETGVASAAQWYFEDAGFEYYVTSNARIIIRDKETGYLRITSVPLKDGIKAAVADDENIYIGGACPTTTISAKIVVYNKAEGKTIANKVYAQYSFNVNSLAQIDTSLYIACESNAGGFDIYDKETNTFQSIAITSDTGRAFAQDETNLYIACNTSGNLVVFNKTTKQITKTVSIGLTTYSEPVIIQDDAHVFIGGTYGRFSVYQKATGQVTQGIDIGFDAMEIDSTVKAMTQDANNVYIGGVKGRFSIYNKSTGAVTKLIDTKFTSLINTTEKSIAKMIADEHYVYIIGAGYGNFSVYNKVTGQAQRFAYGFSSANSGLMLHHNKIFIGVPTGQIVIGSWVPAD